MSELWKGCLICEDKCCSQDIAHPLYVTPEEMERVISLYPEKAELFNAILPCPFMTEDGLCAIHQHKPVDCRLFPFDIMEIQGKLHWIIRDINCNCNILEDDEIFEEYLSDIESRLLPDFIDYLEDYASFRMDELGIKYGYKVLREVKIKNKPPAKVQS